MIFTVFLGTGGEKAGIEMICQNESANIDLCDLPEGHSVYAIDIDTEEGLIATGSRAGSIEIFSTQNQDKQTGPVKICSLVQGAPLLSVCLPGNRRLISADTRGRCLLWNSFDNSVEPISMATDGGKVCSVIRISDQQIAGLTASGKLLIWDISDGDILHLWQGPTPPEKLSLVELQYWPLHNAIVYPATGGQIVVYRLSNHKLHTWHAHDGEIYVCMVDDEYLYTVGQTDKTMQIWREIQKPPVRQYPCPEGIISGALSGNDPVRIVLIEETGRAVMSVIEADNLTCILSLNGNHYRCVVGPSEQDRRLLHKQSTMALVQQLQSQIQTSLENEEFEDMDGLYQQLADLGCGPLSLVLQARQAILQQDIVAELKARKSLRNTLHRDDPLLAASYNRYVNILEKTWQLAEIEKINSEITPVDKDPAYLKWINHANRIVANNNWLVEPDISIPELIEAASTMQRVFVGQWVIAREAPVTFSNSCLNGEIVAGKYEQVKSERNLTGLLPAGKPENIWWLSRRTYCQEDIVVFRSDSNGNICALQPAVLIHGKGSETILTPIILLEVGTPQQDISVTVHNRLVLETFNTITQQESENLWPSRVYQTLVLTLQRLNNRVHWSRCNGKELI